MAQVVYMDSHPGATVWEIDEPDGKRYIEIWATGATIAEVLRNMPRPKGTKAKRIDVGRFEIAKVEYSYSGDARRVDTSGHIYIDEIFFHSPSLSDKYIAPGFEDQDA